MIKNIYGVDRMRIRGGYGKRVLEHNIREYIDGGYSQEKSREMAVKIARKFFLKAKPGEKLPEYLEE